MNEFVRSQKGAVIFLGISMVICIRIYLAWNA